MTVDKRVARRLRTNATSAMRKAREMRNKLDKEKREYRLAAPLLSAGASDDVVTQFLRRQAETYGIGYIPKDLGGSTTKERFLSMVNDTTAIVRELFGPSWKNFIGHVGLNTSTMRTLRIPNHYISKRTGAPTDVGLANARLAQMVLLVHINGIRESLNDYERQLWVLLQRSHDPSFTGEDASTSRQAVLSRGRQHIREAIGSLLINVPKPYFLPLRALATLEYPHVTSREATILKYHDMIEAKELTTAWLSQKSYDGLQDLETTEPFKRDREEHTLLPARKARGPRKRTERERTDVQSPLPDPTEDRKRKWTWYNHWQHEMHQQHGYTSKFLRNRKRWTKEIWESYTAARERAHLKRKQTEELELVYEPKQTVRSIEAYLAEMRATREREKRQFLRYVNQHAGEPGKAEQMIDEYFAKSKDQEKDLPLDTLVDQRRMGFKHLGHLTVKAKDLSKDPRVLAAQRHREWLLKQIEDPSYEREKEREAVREEMLKRDLDPRSYRDRQAFKYLLMREMAEQLGVLKSEDDDDS